MFGPAMSNALVAGRIYFHVGAGRLKVKPYEVA